jgi:hypothetical protein
MSPGYELLRKNKQFARKQMNERIAAEQRRERDGRRPPRAGSGSSGRIVQGLQPAGTSCAEGRGRKSAGHGPRAAGKAIVVADGHYIYTPRGVSGTAGAEMQHYDVLPQMRKSLAKSAREATDAIAAHEAAERKKRTEGGAGSWLREEARKPKRNVVEEIMGPSLHDDGDEGDMHV